MTLRTVISRNTFKPFAKVGHRNGRVFLRIVRMTKYDRAATMLRMTPTEASDLLQQLDDAIRKVSIRKFRISNG